MPVTLYTCQIWSCSLKGNSIIRTCEDETCPIITFYIGADAEQKCHVCGVEVTA